jgi:hypothetical protein
MTHAHLWLQHELKVLLKQNVRRVQRCVIYWQNLKFNQCITE